MSLSRMLARGFYQAGLGLTLATLTIFTSPTVSQAQTRRIQISNEADIQALFDLVYRPGQDPQRFRLQSPEEKEAHALLTTILQTGTQVYLRSTQDGNYASYNLTQDVLLLRPSSVAHWGIFLETLRHEGWHIVQACFGSRQGATGLIPVGLQVSRRTILNLRQNHSYSPEEIPVEAEAFEAENYPNLTLKSLQQECAPWLQNQTEKGQSTR